MTGGTPPGADVRAYAAWVMERALPFWAEQGFDRQHGRFHERLDLGGQPLDVPHRAMVQARQIYVFAHAADQGFFPQGADLALAAMAKLRSDYRRGGPGAFAFSIDRSGRPVSDVNDAYTYAFLLLALAWTYRLSGSTSFLDEADDIIGFIDRTLMDDLHGGLYDAVPINSRAKRQNPLMHLLESYLALASAAPDRGYQARATQIVDIFSSRLLSGSLLKEHFERDWSAHPDPTRAEIWEPGHHFEWVWLLDVHDRLTGSDTRVSADRLYETAHRHGVSADGLIFDELDCELRVVKGSHRVWPHTEAIKAANVVYRRSRSAEALAFSDQMGRMLLDRFLDGPFAGGWIDHVNAGGDSLVDYIPSSTLYHLFVAAADTIRTAPLTPGSYSAIIPETAS